MLIVFMIQTNELTVKFPNEETIRYKNLVFESGKKYMILGPSGCGKSTLLNVIAGILTPTSGEVFVDGKCISHISQKEKDAFRIKNIGYIFQDFKLIEDMTVSDNIDILRLEGIDTSDKVNALATLGMRIYKDKKVKQLSGGQKQRVAVARALVKSPSIVLADEPTGNLNFSVGELVVELLVSATHGKTLIVVTHDERLAKYFDEVLSVQDIIFTKEENVDV